MRVLVALLLMSSVALGDHTLSRVSCEGHQKGHIEARVKTTAGVVLSGSPQTKTKYCPDPENTKSTATGSVNCAIGSLSYSLTQGRAKAYAFLHRTAGANYLHLYSHHYAGSNKVIVNGHKTDSIAYTGQYLKNRYKISGDSTSYNVKCKLRVKLRNPTGVAGLQTGDKYKVKQYLYINSYNYLIATWDPNEGSTGKWKLDGYYQPLTGAPQEIDTHILDSGQFSEKSYEGWHGASNNTTFEHSAWYNWDTEASWDTTYGIELHNDAPADPDKTLKFQNYGWIDIIQTVEL